MTYTNLLTTISWGKVLGGRSASVEIADFAPAGEDSRRAVLAKDLDQEWIEALESADYSHLPSLKKITA